MRAVSKFGVLLSALCLIAFAVACGGEDGQDGLDGEDGDNVTAIDLAEGHDECPQGGQKVLVGPETKPDGEVDEDADSTEVHFICDGAPGDEGPQGPAGDDGDDGDDGEDGRDVIVESEAIEAEDDACGDNTGTLFTFGYPDEDGNLDEDEIIDEAVVCDGEKGEKGDKGDTPEVTTDKTHTDDADGCDGSGWEITFESDGEDIGEISVCDGVDGDTDEGAAGDDGCTAIFENVTDDEDARCQEWEVSYYRGDDLNTLCESDFGQAPHFDYEVCDGCAPNLSTEENVDDPAGDDRTCHSLSASYDDACASDDDEEVIVCDGVDGQDGCYPELTDPTGVPDPDGPTCYTYNVEYHHDDHDNCPETDEDAVEVCDGEEGEAGDDGCSPELHYEAQEETGDDDEQCYDVSVSYDEDCEKDLDEGTIGTVCDGVDGDEGEAGDDGCTPELDFDEDGEGDDGEQCYEVSVSYDEGCNDDDLEEGPIGTVCDGVDGDDGCTPVLDEETTDGLCTTYTFTYPDCDDEEFEYDDVIVCDGEDGDDGCYPELTGYDDGCYTEVTYQGDGCANENETEELDQPICDGDQGEAGDDGCYPELTGYDDGCYTQVTYQGDGCANENETEELDQPICDGDQGPQGPQGCTPELEEESDDGQCTTYSLEYVGEDCDDGDEEFIEVCDGEDGDDGCTAVYERDAESGEYNDDGQLCYDYDVDYQGDDCDRQSETITDFICSGAPQCGEEVEVFYDQEIDNCAGTGTIVEVFETEFDTDSEQCERVEPAKTDFEVCNEECQLQPFGDCSGVDFTDPEGKFGILDGDLSGLDLRYIDFSYATFEEANFEDAKLTGADFFGATFTDSIVTGDNYRGATFDDADLSGTGTFSAEDFETSTFSANTICPDRNEATQDEDDEYTCLGTQDDPCTLAAGASCRDHDLSGETLEGDLTDIDLSGTTLEGATLDGVILDEATLAETDFTNADIQNSTFDGAQTEDDADVDQEDLFATTVTFDGAEFTGDVSFNNTDLTAEEGETTSFDGATFIGDADFTGATMNGATTFVDADFEGPTDFEDTTFEEVDFTDSTFVEVADFIGQSFDTATFDGATFSSPANFTDAELQNSTFASTTFGDEATFDEADLEGVSFDGAHFSDATSFDELVLSEGAIFDNATFGTTVTFGGVLDASTFIDTTFASADAEDEADFTDSNLTETTFDADFLTAVSFDGATLSDEEGQAVVFDGTHFDEGVVFDEKMLDDASFARVSTGEGEIASFVDADLDTANFDEAELPDADFTRADASASTFRNTGLSGAIFHGARVVDGAAFLSTADCAMDDSCTDLSGADFSSIVDEESETIANETELHADFSGADTDNLTSLENASFAYADVTDTRFDNTDLTGADLRGAVGFPETTGTEWGGTDCPNFANVGDACDDEQLNGCRLIAGEICTDAEIVGYQWDDNPLFRLTEREHLENITFDNSDLSGSNASFSNLGGASFDGDAPGDTDLSGAIFEETTLDNADFTNVILDNADFTNAFLRNSALIEDADLDQTDFSGADLEDIEFRGDNIGEGTVFDDANLRYAILTGVDLTAPTFTGTNIRSADFSNAELDGVDWSDARDDEDAVRVFSTLFEGVQFEGNTTFGNQTLEVVNLRDAEFEFVDDPADVFQESTINLSDLEGMCGIADGDIADVTFDNQTTCPTGVESGDNGGTCEGEMIEECDSLI